jgi:hypothetical protein
MTEQPGHGDGFAAQCHALTKPVFADIVRDELARGSDAEDQARRYAEQGKPDFTLAYLLAGALPDDERRELLAHAFERRAALTEERAREFDSKFHRPFPMLYNDAANDRATAWQVRAGKRIRAETVRQLPMA